MINVFDKAAELRRQGQPFVLATVVRSVKPASAKSGDRALIMADRRTVGWVGGGCVHTSIEREALQALSDGQPRLVRLSPDTTPEEGITSYPMTCHSGGTLDIYLEPVLPLPQLVILGADTPVVEALHLLGEPLGFTVHGSLAEITNAKDAWIVVAGMSGSEDDELVKAALLSGASYVALVASRRRAEVLLSDLRSDNVAEDALARLKAPAGLDIGAATGPEIALSILAEIIQRRRTRSNITPAAEPRHVIDPICGMEVDPATARWTAERDGETYYFCAPGCRKTFLAGTAVTHTG